MSKIVLLGDTHLGTRGGNEHFLSFQIKWFEYFLKECSDRGVDRIIQLGDFFDVRKSTDNQLLNALVDYFIPMIQKAGIPWTVLVGNHDTYYKTTNRINSVQIIENLVGNRELFSCVNSITTDAKSDCTYDLVPWINDSNIDSLDNLLKSTDSEYCIGHFEFSEFPMSLGVDAKHGLDSTLFKKYTKVFSGHYHTVSDKSNVLYVGSPYHLTWSDEADGDNRGFWIFDESTKEYSLIKNSIEQTLFVRYEYQDSVEYDKNPTFVKDMFEGKVVKIFVNQKNNKKNFKEFEKCVNQTDTISCYIIDNTIIKVDKDVPVDVIEVDSSIQKLIENYCDTQNNISASVKSKTLDIFRRAELNRSV